MRVSLNLNVHILPCLVFIPFRVKSLWLLPLLELSQRNKYSSFQFFWWQSTDNKDEISVSFRLYLIFIPFYKNTEYAIRMLLGTV